MDTDTVTNLAQRIATRLGQIDGIVAVALGGSWARGTAGPDSDVDLGIYYRPAQRPSLAALRRLAQEIDDRHLPDLVTNFGEWGPWINGGAWLQIDGQHVDWLFRDLDRVAHAIDECRAGQPTCDYQIGHPHGFHSHIYMGEVHVCRALHDPTGAVAQLKTLTAVYPAALRQVLINRYLFEAQFSIDIARTPAQRGDAAYVAGCLFRCVACLVQVLCALNEEYCLNEKGAVALIETLRLHPDGFSATVGQALRELGPSGVDRMATLVDATRALCIDLPGLSPAVAFRSLR
jgi:predicted nucleotidyltransferase